MIGFFSLFLFFCPFTVGCWPSPWPCVAWDGLILLIYSVESNKPSSSCGLGWVEPCSVGAIVSYIILTMFFTYVLRLLVARLQVGFNSLWRTFLICTAVFTICSLSESENIILFTPRSHSCSANIVSASITTSWLLMPVLGPLCHLAVSAWASRTC